MRMMSGTARSTKCLSQGVRFEVGRGSTSDLVEGKRKLISMSKKGRPKRLGNEPGGAPIHESRGPPGGDS
jgi:hypothetical protein